MHTSVKKIREKLGLSQKKFGQKVGVGQSTIANYENGRTVSLPVARKIVSFCKLNGLIITLDYIYKET